MKSDEEKKCSDCLHCKVCANSSKNNRLCYCSKTKNKEREVEFYWYVKKACKRFVDMSA